MLKINQRAGGLRFASLGGDGTNEEATPLRRSRSAIRLETGKNRRNVAVLAPTAVADVSLLRRHFKLYLNEAYDAH